MSHHTSSKFEGRAISKPSFVIRLAISSERAELEALQWRASLSNPGDREALLAHPDAIHLPVEQIDSGDVFVAELDGVAVGFAALRPRADQETELDALFVEPRMQRRGIGRLLLEHCISVAHERKFCVLEVIANPHAKEFYAVCGFILIGTSQTQFGSALLMRRSLV
jgi:GNAT superfamily N-acetyltransferase